MHYATVNKYLTPQVSSADISALVNNQLNTGTKYAISAKSLGLGDIGDLCGILPINTLLGKTLISANDANASSKFLFANNIGTAVCAGGSETTSLSGFSQQTTQCIGSASSTNQNFMLNPNLAAAVAAAISNSSFTFSSGNSPVVNNGPSLTTNIPTLNAPSIALTGPSGEILGTIPIASANPPQNILSSALGSNVVQPSINNSLTTVSVTLPANPITGSSTGLANTLNWLRCATTPVDPTSHQVIKSGSKVAPNSSQAPISNSDPTSSAIDRILQTIKGCMSANANRESDSKLKIRKNESNGTYQAFTGDEVGSHRTNDRKVTGARFSPINLPSGVSFVPMHYATVNKYLTPQVSSADISALVNNQLNTGTKYAISAKSLGLGDIGDLCGILPINTLLGKTLISANDANASSKFLFANNIGTAVCAGGSETTSLSGFSQQTTQCIGSASSTNQNFMLNPNLAAAVAAAISNSSFTFSSGNSPVVNNGPSLTTNIPTLNAPSIALTGPSGEILGTIPIASANPPQNILSSALGSNVVQPSINNSLTTVSVTLPANPITGSSTGLANTLNWLRCATTPVDPTSHQVIKSGSKVAPNSSQAPISNSDPTSSAIDRILQTIKGCMSANANRESDSKLKIRKNESNGTYQAFTGDEVGSHRTNDRKVTGARFSPINKNSLALENDCVSRSSSTNDRLPLPPLQKSAGESSESSSSIPINKFYRCRYCGKTFNRKFCRERHERLHTGVKPYSCELCDEKFIRLEDKKRHVRSLQHYFSGRGSLRNNGLDDQLDETAGLATEPSSVLPLLAQTLQGGTNVEPVGKEGDEPCNGTDELNFSNHASENESEPAAALELDESFNPEENESCTDDLKSDSHLTVYDRSYIVQQEGTEDKPREIKPKLEGPSDDLLTNLRLTSKIQVNKARCRVALKETQTAVNSTSGSDYEIIKIPTVVLSNTDDATNSKPTT
ncbi:hypothetical protein MN116_007055 [Schistosoma mekongi]|uniref:C2H2-type domain-containing protein n=1 Tax=Schistosoma mekongi TaxID=38744 RepID=A0AAE2D439_SCHME|nr:hypothetical protein MN116_007055 [Schistosoma mekongi]